MPSGENNVEASIVGFNDLKDFNPYLINWAAIVEIELGVELAGSSPHCCVTKLQMQRSS